MASNAREPFLYRHRHTQKPSRILIRARCEKDINHLFNRYREKPPTSDDARDYRCRLSIVRKTGELARPQLKPVEFHSCRLGGANGN